MIESEVDGGGDGRNECVHTLTSHTAEVLRVTWAPADISRTSRDLLCTGSADGTARLWTLVSRGWVGVGWVEVYGGVAGVWVREGRGLGLMGEQFWKGRERKSLTTPKKRQTEQAGRCGPSSRKSQVCVFVCLRVCACMHVCLRARVCVCVCVCNAQCPLP